MTDKEMAENFVDAFLKKDDFELDKFLDENLGNLKLTTKQAGVILGVIKGVGIGSYQAGLKAGKDEAKEWHYVKDELPPIKKEYNGRSEPVLVLSKEKEMQYAQYVEKEKTWVRGICEINFKPYAWKEIELPKEEV